MREGRTRSALTLTAARRVWPTESLKPLTPAFLPPSRTPLTRRAGQFFVFFDWIHETLTPPKHRREQWNWDARHKGSKAVKSE